MATLSTSMSGMTPEQIKAWQTTLKGAGYDPGGIDGVWGANTQAAYNAYKTTGTTPVSSAPVEQPKEVKNTDILSGIPGYKSTSPTGLPDMPNVDIPGAYDSAAQKYKDYLDAAYGSQQASTEAQAAKLKQQYDATRNSAYVGSRLSAIGNNEALAANGLAGNMYAAPTSGVSETSRIAQDIALRGNINSANLQENAARDSLAQELLQAGFTRDMNYAQYMAQAIIDKANAQNSYEQQRFQNGMSIYDIANQLAAQQNAATGYSGGSMGGYTGVYTPTTTSPTTTNPTPNPDPVPTTTTNGNPRIAINSILASGGTQVDAYAKAAALYANDQLTASEYKSMLDYIDSMVKTRTESGSAGALSASGTYKNPLVTREVSMK